MNFFEWLYGNGGISGDFDYGKNYLISIGLVVLFTVVLGIIAGSKINPKAKRIVLVSIAWFQLGFELLWRIVYLCRGDSFLSLWPFYICNLNGILLPIAVLTKSQTMKKLFYVFGFLGGIITFAMPQGIFNNAYLTFPILKSMLQHTGLLFIPVFEYVSGTFRPKFKDLIWSILGLFIHVVNSEGIARLLGYPGDYLYFNSGLPFVINGVPGFVIMSVTALLVLTITSILIDPQLIAKHFRKRNKNTIAVEFEDGVVIKIEKNENEKRTE